jgi:TonB family protein
MNIRIAIVVLGACLAFVCPAGAQEQAPPKPTTGVTPPGTASLPIEGAYAVEGGAWLVRVVRLTPDMFWLQASEGWEGVGILDGVTYRGVFRDRVTQDKPEGAMGELTVDWSDLRNPSMTARYTVRRTGQIAQRWRRLSDSTAVPLENKANVVPREKNPNAAPMQNPNIVVVPPAPGERPQFGEYVYVEKLPEAITKYPPVYPNEARNAGIEGVVLIQALVIEDGSVADTRLVKSLPGLDDAAIASVRQWRFKPALAHGKPVAVWVAVPVSFSLH